MLPVPVLEVVWVECSIPGSGYVVEADDGVAMMLVEKFDKVDDLVHIDHLLQL